MFLEIICLITLVIAAISDFKTMEVDPVLFLVGGATEFTYFILHGNGRLQIPAHERAMAFIAVFGFMLAFAVFTELGGADVLSGALTGFTIGYASLCVILIACVTTLPFLAYWKIKGKSDQDVVYPFIPFIAAAYLFVLISMEVMI